MTDEAAGTGRGGDGVDPSTRAEELRATLGAIVDEAQQLSEQLIAESREAAARTNREAQDKADALLARARADAEEITAQARAAADAVRARAEADVEEHRRRVRAEVTEQVTRQVTEQSRRDLARVRAQSHDVIGDLEASVRILGVSLESAVTNIADMLSALEALRSHMVDPEAEPGDAAVVAEPQAAAVHTQESRRSGDEGFGAQVPSSFVPATPTVFDQAGSAAAGEVVQRADHPEDAVPLTATEAFLRSSQLDPDHVDVPPIDRAAVEERWGEETPSTTDEERPHAAPPRSRPEPEEAREGDEQGKPLGWLFRSPQ